MMMVGVVVGVVVVGRMVGRGIDGIWEKGRMVLLGILGENWSVDVVLGERRLGLLKVRAKLSPRHDARGFLTLP
jgi:hypothetical protein